MSYVVKHIVYTGYNKESQRVFRRVFSSCFQFFCHSFLSSDCKHDESSYFFDHSISSFPSWTILRSFPFNAIISFLS